MKAFCVTNPFTCEVRDLTPPEPRSGNLILRVHVVGLCGSDLSTYRGKNRMVTYPRVPGHEIGATVEQVGSGTSSYWAPGMGVTVSPYSNCGECSACRRGRVNACMHNETMGVQRDGAMCELIEVPEERVYHGGDLSVQELALVEPLAVGTHAARRAEVANGTNVAVLGCGAIGLGVVTAAAYAGANVTAVDVAEEKLDTAAALGAAETVNAVDVDPVSTLKENTGGDGPDAVIEAIGMTKTFQQAIDLIGCTGRVVYVGYAPEPVTYDTTLFVKKELDIRGSRNALPDDFKQVITMLNSGFVHVDPLISRRTSLTEAGTALEHWHQNPADVKKILVNLSSNTNPAPKTYTSG